MSVSYNTWSIQDLTLQIVRTESRIKLVTNKGSKLSLQKELKKLVAIRQEKLVWRACGELHTLNCLQAIYKQPII